MKKRIITGLVLGLILIPAIYFGGIYYLIISLLLVYLATYELMNMFYTKDLTLKYMRFIVPIFSMILMVLVYLGNNANPYQIGLNDKLYLINYNNASPNLYFVYLISILCSLLLFIIIILVCNIFMKETTAHSILASITSLIYGGLLFSSALGIEYIKPISVVGGDSYFAGVVLAYLFITVIGNDIFAYFLGRKFGKHKLCPTISPNKTIEGAISGGVIGSILGTLSLFLLNIMPINFGDVTKSIVVVILTFIVTIVLSVVVQIGDLVASKFKRSYEIKDYGYIFPGHGGVMDRFDSLILSGALLSFIFLVVNIILIASI